MSHKNEQSPEDEMRPEYDLRGGVRGKYYEQYKRGTNVVLLDSDVAEVFHDSESVNQALRVLIKAAEQVEAGQSHKVSETKMTSEADRG